MTTIEKLDMNVKQVNSDFVAIKNKIVEKGVEVADGTRTTEYANKIDDVYEAGKKSEYDKFWDGYQLAQNGISLVYSANYMFAHAGWNDETFKPKHSMLRLTVANNMFNTCCVSDLKAALERQGVVFDFSGVTSFASAFAYSELTVVPEINAKVGANLSNMFYYSKLLHTIDKLILAYNGSQTFSSLFYQCESLENLTIEGTIGQNGFNVQWSTKLTHDSLMSIINALRDNRGTSTWNTITLGDANLAKLTEDELFIMEQKQWEYN